MSNKILILTFVILAFFLVIGYTTYLNDRKKIMEKEITIKSGESRSIGDLLITNNGGGHDILIDGSDESFANIYIKTKSNENVSFMLSGKDTKLWNGYSLKIKDIEWNGSVITLLVSELEDRK